MFLLNIIYIFLLKGSCDLGSGRGGNGTFNLLDLVYPTTGYVGGLNPLLQSFDVNNWLAKIDHLIFFGTLERK